MKKDTQEAAFRQRVLEYQQRDHTVTETAIRYHLSRKTVHKWRNRWDGTPKSLLDRSRRPRNSPRKQTEDEIRLVRRQAKKYKWQDHILAYQGAKERGYTRSFGCFTKTVRKLLDEKPKRAKKKRRKYMYDELSTYSSLQFLHRLVKECPFQIKRIQTDNGIEFTKQLKTNDPRNLTSFELGLKAYGIEYQRIRVATPRHNGKVERQHRIDQSRFYNSLRMFSLLDGQRQLADYQRKSNGYIKGCLGMRSPNQMVELYLGVM